VDRGVDLPHQAAESGKMFSVGVFTIVLCNHLVLGRDVGCGNVCTRSKLAASFMSRVVH